MAGGPAYPETAQHLLCHIQARVNVGSFVAASSSGPAGSIRMEAAAVNSMGQGLTKQGPRRMGNPSFRNHRKVDAHDSLATRRCQRLHRVRQSARQGMATRHPGQDPLFLSAERDGAMESISVRPREIRFKRRLLALTRHWHPLPPIPAAALLQDRFRPLASCPPRPVPPACAPPA